MAYVAVPSASKLFFNNANTFYVALTGSDSGNDGSVDRPLRTIQAAVTAAASGDCILVGPGNFAETVAINKNLSISALVPGATSVNCATAAVTTLTVTGAVANQTLSWEGIHIVNSDNSGITSLALAVIGGGVAGTYVFRNCNIIGGAETANAGAAVSFTGNAGNGAIVDIQSPKIVGAHYINILHAADEVIYRECTFDRGPALWMRVIGNAAGNVKIIASTHRGLTTTEYIEYGNAAATTALLSLISSKMNCYLRLNTTAAGYVTIEDSSVTYTTSNQVNQVIRYVNGDYIRFNMQNIDLNSAAIRTMYTVPGAGRYFCPERVQTANRGAVTGGGPLQYRYGGTGAATVVAMVVGNLAQGTTVNTVVQDAIVSGGTLKFEVAVAANAGSVGEATVWGRLV